MHLVAVHGYPLDHRLWSPLAGLAKSGGLGGVTSVFAPDLRGRGVSPRPAAAVHTMALFADDLAEDIDANLPPGAPFLLAGLSMGGYVTFEFLARHTPRFRHRLAGLALFDTKAAPDDEAGRARRREAIDAIRKEGIGAALTAMLPKLLGPASRGGEAETTARAMILETPSGTACADLAGLAERGEGFAALAALDRPLLVAVGEDDAITPPADARAMVAAAAHAPWVKLLTIPGAGHLAPLEKPNEAAAGIRMLAQAARAGPPTVPRPG
jgi:pimeloyl-ACP methyl ester carboxylesterase